MRKKIKLFLIELLCATLFLVMSTEAQSVYIPDIEYTIEHPSLGQSLETTEASSLKELLSETGLNVQDNPQSSLSIAGFTGSCIKVYVDGVLANNPFTGEFDWNSIPLDSIESIELVPIALGKLDFSGTAVYITTKFYNLPQVMYSYTSKSYLDSVFDTNLHNFTYSNYFKRLVTKLDLSLSNEKNFFTSEAGATGKFLTDKFSSQLFLELFYGSVVVSSTTRYSFDFQQDSSFDERISNIYSQLDAIVNFDKSKLLCSADFSKQSLDYKSALESTDHSTYVYHLLFDYSIANLKFTLTNELLQYKDILSYQPVLSAVYSTTNLDVSAAVSFKNKFYFNPAISYRPFEWLTLYCSRMFNFPTINQLYWKSLGCSGSTGLKPESGFQTGIFLGLSDYFTLELRYSFYKDKICWRPSQGILQAVNSEAANFFYACISSSHKYTYFGYRCDLKINEARLCESWKQVMWVPEFETYSEISLFLKSFKLTLSLNTLHNRYRDNSNYSKYPDIYELAAAMSYTHKDLTFFLKANNLLNQQALLHDNFVVEPFTVHLGFKFKTQL